MTSAKASAVSACVRVCGLLLLATAALAHAQDGAVDLKFAAGKGASDDIYDLAAVPSGGGFLVAGHFTTFDGRDRWRLARLHLDGSLDETFDPHDSTGSAPVNRVVALPDGGGYIGGPFTRFDGRERRLVARLRTDGSLDPKFDASGAFGRSGGVVQALVPLAEGRLLVAGRFDSPADANTAKGIVRLQPDGTVDEGFRGELRVGQEGDVINALVALPDGKLLAAGRFSPAGNVARLEANGHADPSFHLAGGLGVADDMVVQPDGRILVAFTDGARRYVARLETDGALDAGFHADPLAADEDGHIETLAVQADGAILVGGSFRQWAGVRRNGLARLRPDGSLDQMFEPGTGLGVLPLDDPGETPEATVRAFLPLPGGRLLVAGRFDLYNGALCHNLARVFDTTQVRMALRASP